MMQTMEERLNSLAGEHRARGILLDTNVLLLFLFAIYQPAMIGKKRLEKYGSDDGILLVQYVQRFDRILTTQHVLAETSNLIRQIIKGQHRSEFAQKLYPLFCSDIAEAFEQCPVTGSDINNGLFARLGLTDAGLVSLVQTNLLLLTDDLDLFAAAIGHRQNAINFTHMREAAGLL
jgi:hypothetical protein